MSTTWPDSTRGPPSSAFIFASARLVRFMGTGTHEERIRACTSPRGRPVWLGLQTAGSPARGSRSPVPGPPGLRTPGSRLPAPGPSVSRETIGGPRATPPPRAFRARAPPPFGCLTRALHIRAVARPIGISVQIVAHSFTCRLRGCREGGSMFDKVRREMLATNAHLCRSSPEIG